MVEKDCQHIYFMYYLLLAVYNYWKCGKNVLFYKQKWMNLFQLIQINGM